MYNVKRNNNKRVHHTHNYSRNECPLLLLLIKAQTALIQGINVFLVCQVAYFKKDGQDLVEVRRLELQGLSLVSGL